MPKLQQKNNESSNRNYEYTLSFNEVNENSTNTIIKKAMMTYEKRIKQQRMKIRQEMLLKEIY